MSVVFPPSPEWETLVKVVWILLIPIGFLVVLLLYQVLLLLFTLTDLVSLARHEVVPTLKNVRLSSGHAEALTGKVVSGVEGVERGFKKFRLKKQSNDCMQTGLSALSKVTQPVQAGFSGVVSGLQRAFKPS
jgi:hypothetical protein